MNKLHLTASLALSLLVLPACGSSDEQSSVEWATGPLFVGTTRVFNADGSLGYIHFALSR